MKRAEITTGAVCVIFFSFMLVQGYDLIEVKRFGEVGSGFWPVMSLVACLGLSVAWLIMTVVESRKAGEKSAVTT